MGLSVIGLAAIAALSTAGVGAAGPAKLKVVPKTFVGTAAQCGGPAGSKIVTSMWLAGVGLSDNGVPTANNAHDGLLMSKNGPTPNCSAPYAEIQGYAPGTQTLNDLGFDYRLGSHCGAGAPRYNVYLDAAGTKGYFFGCAYGTHSAAPGDASQWERVRFSAADGFAFGGALAGQAFSQPYDHIEIVFDEGTDAPAGPNDAAGVGLVIFDNFKIGSVTIPNRAGTTIIP